MQGAISASNAMDLSTGSDHLGDGQAERSGPAAQVEHAHARSQRDDHGSLPVEGRTEAEK